MPALPALCVLSVLHLQLSHRREALHHGRATAQGWPSLRRFFGEKIVDISYLMTHKSIYIKTVFIYIGNFSETETKKLQQNMQQVSDYISWLTKSDLKSVL